MIVAVLAALWAWGADAAGQSRDVVLATTTSVRDAGLLDALVPDFERRTGRAVKVIAVGSGQAMELGRRGEADILILHDPAGEERFVREGHGIERRPLMRNEFILVGPPSDPAGVRGSDAHAAMRRIAAGSHRFVSRGDRSGTHVREQRLWGDLGITPDGEWYLESGQGMGATLLIASEKQAYALSDIATFLGHQYPLALAILVQRDPALQNRYHVILVNPERVPHVNREGAAALAGYLLSEDVQRRIGDFRRDELGRSIFIPDAGR